MLSEDISEHTRISLYRSPFPDFVGIEMDRLYQHMFSSFSFHSIYENVTADTCAYIARRNGEAVAALLFRIDDDAARVLNEQFTLAPEEINRFCRYIFQQYGSVKQICFPVIEDKAGRLEYPCQRSFCTNDIVLTLPATADEYMNRLGKSTRSYVKRYLNKLKRAFPTVAFKTFTCQEVSDAHIRSIIALNKARMADRHTASYIDEEEEERIIRLVKMCGLVNLIEIDDVVCAGTINFRFGDHFFLKIVAHDPRYDKYGLGTLCCYLAICECIKRKGKEYHFLWGRYEYKYRLLGIQRDLSHLAIYRSRLQLLRHGGEVLKYAYRDRAYIVKDWLEHRARKMDESSMHGRAIFHILNGLKTMKRSLLQMKSQRARLSDVAAPLQKE